MDQEVQRGRSLRRLPRPVAESYTPPSPFATMPPPRRGNSKIPGLLDAVTKHKKFKQMASYNLQCLATLITPPNPEWRDNVDEVVAAGGIDAIVDVLKEHPGNEDVLSVAAASCISSGMAFFAYTPGSASFTATSAVALFAATFSISRASHASHTSRLQKRIYPVGVCVYLLLCSRDADTFSTQRCPLISH